MRKLLLSLVALTMAAMLCAPAFAQVSTTPFPVPQYYASAFGTWSLLGQSPNTYTFAGRNICNGNAQNTPFFFFNTNAPVYIADVNTANSEVDTPSAIVNTAGSCGVTIATTNNHYSFSLRSGTGGLQEAINTVTGAASLPAEIVLDRNWYAFANNVPNTSAAAIIAAAAGSSGIYLVDITTAPNTYYSWNGSAYTPSATNITPPTVAAGSGAGGSPTISIVGTGTSGFVTLTSGTTPTASATIFTLTWPSVANGGFQYAPTCTITSTGTRAYTGTNASVAGPPAVDTYTATSTALTASVSGYKWKYVCR